MLAQQAKTADGGIEHPWIGKTTETTRIHKDGRLIDIELSVSRWNTDTNVYFTGIHRDIRARLATEAKLKTSEAWYRSIVENTTEGIVAIDSDSIVATFNPTAEKMFGYAAKEIIGQKVSILMAEHERVQHDRQVANSTLYEPQVINQRRELFGRRKNGETFPLELNVARLEGMDRKMYVGIMRDVTDRRKLEKDLKTSQIRYQDFAETATHILWESDNQRRISYMSPSVEKITGESPLDYIGKPTLDFPEHPFVDKEPYRLLWGKLNRFESFDDIIISRPTNHGGLSHVSISGKALFDENGGFIGYRGSARDVTEKTNADKELKAAKNEADRANMAKSEFLSSMSHELRTPLNSIIGFAQMLEFNAKTPLTESQQKCVDHILTGGKHLLDLINEVLDLSRIETGNIQLNIEKFPINPLIEECLNLSESITATNDIRLINGLNSQDEIMVRADRTRIKQVIINLVSNAIKYNRDHGTVDVTIGDTSPTFCRIVIADSGFGIPEGKQASLFKPFQRLGAENSSIEGTGIGLALSKNLIESMGGQIGFESIEGQGTRFWVDIPITERIAELHDETPPVSGPKNLPLTEKSLIGALLYIEDNPANLDLMRMVVEEIEGLEFISAPTGEIGIEKAVLHRPSIIVADINLPGISGYEVLHRLQALEETRYIPVIALSALAMPSHIEKGLNAGFVHYLLKPLKIDEAIKIIRQTIKGTEK